MKQKKEKFPIITLVYTIIYAIIWIVLGWLFVILLQCLPQPWNLIVCGLLATLFLMSLELFINTLKALKDPDVITASNLGMSILHYNKYKKIQAQLEELYNRGVTEGDEINKLMKQIPNMNEWRRFNEYHYQLEKDRWKQMLEDINKDD